MSKMDKKSWGSYNGKDVYLYTLTNKNKVAIKISSYGGTIVSISVPDRKGSFDDVTLGCNDLEGYINHKSHFGCLVGRFANRIAKGKMSINSVEYQLALNNGVNHLHGGIAGFDRKVWDAEASICEDGDCLDLSYFSRDGEENYPGNLNVKVRYSLSEDNALKISYYADTDMDTAVNLTNHAYFNLSGHASGDILKHEVKIAASKYTPVDATLIPTGEIKDVKGTSMDFTTPHAVGERINNKDEQLERGGGYDHNWAIDRAGVFTEPAAEVYDPSTGRFMEVFTTKPGIQFYSGNFLTGSGGFKDGAAYVKRGGLCLETQYFPDSVNCLGFASPILKKGCLYNHITIYKFSVK